MMALQLGLELRDAGIASLERHAWLHRARDLALEIALHNGTVTSDDVQARIDPPPHENCVGALFKDKRLRSTGKWIQSRRPSAHGRFIQVWEINA